jgi:hypothetical protein
MKRSILFSLFTMFAISLIAQDDKIKRNLYQDPNGYFSIIKPDGWETSKYQEVSRGKVKFINPSNAKINVIIIGQPNPFDSFQSLMADLKNSTKQMETKYKSAGVVTSITNFEIGNNKYAKRDVTFTGLDIRQMSMECIINNIYITISYVSPKADFDKNLYHIYESISTIATSKETYSTNNIKAAMVESKISQAKINIQVGKKDWALIVIEEGLKIDPSNKILLELKNNLKK